MGVLFELTAYTYNEPSTTYEPFAPYTGDSLSVRNFAPPDTAYLQSFDREDATAGVYRVRSPRLHDNVKGVHIATSENPTLFGIPAYNNQQLFAQDTLIIEGIGSASTYSLATMGIFYTNLPGSGARQHMWGDFSNQIAYLETIEVACSSAATAGNWQDTVITTTEDLTKANTDYALLGYTVDTFVGAVAIKGADTSNFRIGGPGRVATEWTADYFVKQSNMSGRPCIPVFNSANKNNTYVSIADIATSKTTNVTLYLACLSTNLAS